MGEDTIRTLVSRTIEGTEALVNSDPGEIFLDIPASNPRYIRVQEGDVIREGDVRTADEGELESSTLDKWRVETIGSETVTGINLETGEPREWIRETLERQLGIGGLSTDLTDFERVTVAQTEDDQTDDGDGHPSGDVTAIVSVYGNDSQKFVQTYRVIEDDGERRLELVNPDRQVEKFDEDLSEQFTQAVELALRSEGYAV